METTSKIERELWDKWADQAQLYIIHNDTTNLDEDIEHNGAA